MEVKAKLAELIAEAEFLPKRQLAENKTTVKSSRKIGKS